MKHPTLQELITRAENTAIGELGYTNKAVQAIAAMIAGASYGEYQYADYLFNQLFVESADEDWLALHASRYSTPRIDAAFATGTANFEQTGGAASIPVGSQLQTRDGRKFEVTKEGISDTPIEIQALIAGHEGNLSVGTQLELVTAVTGLNPDKITASTGGGSDIEDVEHWRDRIITARDNRDGVGELKDYVHWAKSAHPDIDVAWGLDNTPELGHVTVYLASKTNTPILNTEVNQAALDYIETRRLAGCHPHVLTPTTKAVDITLADVENAATRTAIEQALSDLLLTTMDNRASTDPSLSPGDIVNVISPITADFSLIAPLGKMNPADNEILILGSITWQ